MYVLYRSVCSTSGAVTQYVGWRCESPNPQWIKVKYTLVQALRLCTGRTGHRGSRGIALLFHDHGTRRGWGLASRPVRSLPPGKTRYPLYRSLGGPQGRSGRAKNLAPPPGIDPLTLQPVVSRYTDWATRPTYSESTKFESLPKHQLSLYISVVFMSFQGKVLIKHQIRALSLPFTPFPIRFSLSSNHSELCNSNLLTSSLTLKLLMSYIYGAPILDVSRSHTTTHHSR